MVDELVQRQKGARILLEPIHFMNFPHPMPFAVATLFVGNDPDNTIGSGICKVARQVRRMTNVDLVMLTLERHPEAEACGWTQKIVPMIQHPLPPDPRSAFHMAKLYTKLHLWNLTQYERVLYLDLDTLPVAQFSEIFKQPLKRDCVAAMAIDAGHNDRYFNAGVILVLPNTENWHNLLGNVTIVLHDLSAAEQNFLNVYLNDKICMLARKYNAIVADRQRFPEHVSIIHYTHIKVHHWFSSWWFGLKDLVAAWNMA